MKFVYTPEGADPKSWDFDPNKLMNAEAEAIERHTGWNFPEFVERFGNSSMLAFHALLFVMLKRSMPTLKWDEVQFSLSEVDLQLDDNETDEAIATLSARTDLTPAESAALNELIESRGDREPGPKA